MCACTTRVRRPRGLPKIPHRDKLRIERCAFALGGVSVASRVVRVVDAGDDVGDDVRSRPRVDVGDEFRRRERARASSMRRRG